jgi:hypothetical protein
MPKPNQPVGNIDFGAFNMRPQGQVTNQTSTQESNIPTILQRPSNLGAKGMLDQASRQKLDALVNQMTNNGESPEFIQSVVNDFKIKYAGKPQVIPTEQPSKPFIESATDVADVITNAFRLKGVSDVIATNINNVFNPRLMQAQADNFSQTATPNYSGGLTSLKQNIGAGSALGATVAGFAAAPATVPGAIGAGALLGASTAGGNALAQGKSLYDASTQAVKGGAIGGAVGGAVAGIGKLIGKVGDKIMYKEIRPHQIDLDDGFSIETVKEYNLGGTLNQMQKQTANILKAKSEQLAAKLGKSKTPVDLQAVFQKTAQDLGTGGGKLSNFGVNTRVSGSLQSLQDEIAALDTYIIDVPDAQLVKQATGGLGAWKFGNTDPEAKASEIVYNAFYRNLKEAIEQASPAGVKAINAEISKLIPVQNAILRRIPVAARNNAVSLTDFIGLTASTINPAALGLTMVNLLSKSGFVGNQLSKLGGKLITPAGAIGGYVGGATSPLLTPTVLPGRSGQSKKPTFPEFTMIGSKPNK